MTRYITKQQNTTQHEKTFNLGKYGYRAFKYVPYGEVDEVMPYLLRRARENSAIVGATTFELEMIKAELGRRFKGGQVSKQVAKQVEN